MKSMLMFLVGLFFLFDAVIFGSVLLNKQKINTALRINSLSAVLIYIGA